MTGKKYMLVKEQTMFSPEQMTGSGQISINDQLAEIDRRREELRTTPHTFHSDPAHGWLEVQHSDLKIFGIWGEITGYSYQNNGTVYLEEDLDATTYLKKVFPGGWNTPEYQKFLDLLKSKHYDDHCHIRNLPSYTP
jgi:hypothetical protein